MTNSLLSQNVFVYFAFSFERYLLDRELWVTCFIFLLSHQQILLFYVLLSALREVSCHTYLEGLWLLFSFAFRTFTIMFQFSGSFLVNLNILFILLAFPGLVGLLFRFRCGKILANFYSNNCLYCCFSSLSKTPLTCMFDCLLLYPMFITVFLLL